ncbi:hypothetical protein A607_0584 [Helicobacter pylori UMB_G1]|nr:hypothetical protein A607_0584 [Helicobacter pylori UMB_G1]
MLSSSKDKMYSKVDAQIDNLFDPIENNVDKFRLALLSQGKL